MSCTASKVIAVAKAEVGYLEKKSNSNLSSKTGNAGSNNYTKYANDFDKKYTDFYNGKKNGFAWCDIFVDWCMVKAFGEAKALSLLGQPKKSCGAGCEFSANYYKTKKRFYKSPKVGDQIFFKDSSGTPCHTGLVYKVDGSKVYTIEGNTSNASGVVENGGGVAQKSYSLSYNRIYGYGRPNYDKETASQPATTSTTNKTNSNGAECFDSAYKKGKEYYTTANLHIRKAAGTGKQSIGVLKKGTKVMWYGYYTKIAGVTWRYVNVENGAFKGKVGYCSGLYLK